MGNMELTEYEDNILTMYAMGATKKEISKAMGISKYMLNKFSKDILQKLECDNLIQAVVKAVRYKLIAYC